MIGFSLGDDASRRSVAPDRSRAARSRGRNECRQLLGPPSRRVDYPGGLRLLRRHLDQTGSEHRALACGARADAQQHTVKFDRPAERLAFHAGRHACYIQTEHKPRPDHAERCLLRSAATLKTPEDVAAWLTMTASGAQCDACRAIRSILGRHQEGGENTAQPLKPEQPG